MVQGEPKISCGTLECGCHSQLGQPQVSECVFRQKTEVVQHGVEELKGFQFRFTQYHQAHIQFACRIGGMKGAIGHFAHRFRCRKPSDHRTLA